jgi:hypothetical protein
VFAIDDQIVVGVFGEADQIPHRHEGARAGDRDPRGGLQLGQRGGHDHAGRQTVVLAEPFRHQGVAQHSFDRVVGALRVAAQVSPLLLSVPQEGDLLNGPGFNRRVVQRRGARVVLGFTIFRVVDPGARPHIPDDTQIRRELRIHPAVDMGQAVGVLGADDQPAAVPDDLGLAPSWLSRYTAWSAAFCRVSGVFVVAMNTSVDSAAPVRRRRERPRPSSPRHG